MMTDVVEFLSVRFGIHSANVESGLFCIYCTTTFEAVSTLILNGVEEDTYNPRVKEYEEDGVMFAQVNITDEHAWTL